MAPRLAEFVHDDLRLVGSSLAGEETFVVAPELNLTFDLGRAPRETLAVDHVFLSHGHMDHAAGVAYYFSQRMFIDNRPGSLYAPAPLLEPIQRLLRVWADIDGHEPPANLYPAEPGVDVELRRNLVVRPFLVNHPCRRHDGSRVDGLGYAAIEVRHKLIDEYQQLAGPQLVELKRQGVEITRRVELPLVAYCGDTAPGDFLALDYVRNARILLLECTFIEGEDRRRARAGNHLHISDLRAVVARLNNERIVLIHLSRRTALATARRALLRELGEQDSERVSFLMEHRPRGRRRTMGPDAGLPPGAGDEQP
ncbi:MAG: MBL fold metallo-hydrolase [Phycisphaerales bacterium]|nr:MBL fold metallo-hydrolase [Phycisphaerales bacterium]